jgi:hypothetical protein
MFFLLSLGHKHTHKCNSLFFAFDNHRSFVRSFARCWFFYFLAVANQSVPIASRSRSKIGLSRSTP